MNGITGIYGKNSSAAVLENMLGRMIHRGSERKMLIKDEFCGAELIPGNEEKRGLKKENRVLFSGKIYNSDEMTRLLGKPEGYYKDRDDPVSYTHLTLPTNREV